MFNPTKDELRLINRKRSLPKPGRVHGSGPNAKGRGLNKYSVPSGRAVNKENPNIRGQTNAISGMFVDYHESDRYIDNPKPSTGHHTPNKKRQPTNMHGRSLVR